MRSETEAWLVQAWAENDDRGPMSHSVFEVLNAALLAGVIQQGDRIVEGEFIDLFGVSRTPIREAILRLKTEGVLRRAEEGHLVVREIGPDEIVEMYEVREVLDELAARLAARRITEPGLAKLRSANAKLLAAVGGGEVRDRADANIAFHDALFSASGNGFLREQANLVHRRLRRFPGTPLTDDARAREVHVEHEAILEALERRDEDAAAAAARRHIATARDTRIAGF